MLPEGLYEVYQDILLRGTVAWQFGFYTGCVSVVADKVYISTAKCSGHDVLSVNSSILDNDVRQTPPFTDGAVKQDIGQVRLGVCVDHQDLLAEFRLESSHFEGCLCFAASTLMDSNGNYFSFVGNVKHIHLLL